MMSLEELQDEANDLSIEDLQELADFCTSLATALEQENNV